MEGIDKNTFKRIFYDHWDVFKQFRPRFDNPDYNETVNKMLDCGNPNKMGLAYLLLSLLRLRLKTLQISPVEALRELESLYKVYMRDSKKGFKLSRLVALSKKQEKLLKT